MNRYLLNISYIGTYFRGLQKTINKTQEIPLDNSTVQSTIELALKGLKPINDIQLVLSSRTDAGVHALHSTVHVDLERPDGTLYDVNAITVLLNKKFYSRNIPIRILSTIHVPDTFHCRYNAKSRTYLYRFAVAIDSTFHGHLKKKTKYLNFIPVEELNRCFFLHNPKFDIEKIKSVSHLFVGRHDFRSFMGSVKSDRDHPFYALRNIHELSIEPGQSVASSFSNKIANEYYDYWDVKIKGKSFLYRQVRRIVGALFAVGLNRIDEKDIYEMITIPSKNSWCPQAIVASPYGLYLCNVEYNLDDLIFKTQTDIVKD